MTWRASDPRDPLAVACPSCGARPGVECDRTWMRPDAPYRFHQVRVQAAGRVLRAARLAAVSGDGEAAA